MDALLSSGSIILLVILFLVVTGSFTMVPQGHVSVVTLFGRYRRLLHAGLGLKIPFLERIYKRISLQNRAIELQFQATTIDQAHVYFSAMLLYSVLDDQEQTIKNVAFKFVDERSFMQALTRTIEGCVRGFVATKKQSEVLSLRRDIVEHVKREIDATLETWGYHLSDLQINDITFDEEIMKSMSRVVASSNLRVAAENEGQALLITKTKAAEAEGNAIKIAAEAERQASQLRGQGVALFREEVARGMTQAAREMESAHLDASFILFAMWTEALRHFASEGKGNVIFLDGSTDSMKRNLQELMGVDLQTLLQKNDKNK